MSGALAMDRKDWAWDLWQRGLTVLPAHPIQKRPLVSWERYQVEEVSEDLMNYWTSSAKFSECNWALVTGKEYVVVDADSVDAMNWVENNLPYTPLKVSTSRGKHFYFKANPECPVRSSANPDSKIDVRGQGGIVIAPGSIHQSGKTYTIEKEIGIDDPFDGVPMWQAHFVGLIDAENKPTNVVAIHGGSQNTPLGGWHDRMIREVGSKVLRGYTDEQILAEAPAWTEPGYTVEETLDEFQVAIDGARKKWAETIARRNLEKEQEVATANEARRAALAPRPFVLADPAAIPPRQWVYGRHYIRRFLSVTVAAGGSGKTALTLTEALAMAAGKDLLGTETLPRRVWVWNLEDPLEELQRRIAGICQHYNVKQEDFADRLFVNSGRDSKLLIAESERGEAALTPAVDEIIDFINAHRIDVIIVDPFVSSHRLNENDNGQMDLVVKAWGRIADQGNCSVELVHHVRKAQAGQSATYGDARGASALTDAARHVRRLQRMTADEARLAGIDEREFWQYSREADSKDNLAPPSRDSSWRKMVSVEIANGDSIGVMEPWQWPDAFEDVTAEDLARVQTLVRDGEWREDVRSKSWVGLAVAQVLGWDERDESVKSKIKTMINTWIENRELKVVERADAQRRPRRYIEVGDAPSWMTDF